MLEIILIAHIYFSVLENFVLQIKTTFILTLHLVLLGRENMCLIPTLRFFLVIKNDKTRKAIANVYIVMLHQVNSDVNDTRRAPSPG